MNREFLIRKKLDFFRTSKGIDGAKMADESARIYRCLSSHKDIQQYSSYLLSNFSGQGIFKSWPSTPSFLLHITRSFLPFVNRICLDTIVRERRNLCFRCESNLWSLSLWWGTLYLSNDFIQSSLAVLLISPPLFVRPNDLRNLTFCFLIFTQNYYNYINFIFHV